MDVFRGLVGGPVRQQLRTLEIVDDNPPIPDYDHQVLTGDQEMTEVYHSSGLGLWIVYWVVDLSNGSVTYERVDGRNVVRVRLPVTEGEPRKSAAGK